MDRETGRLYPKSAIHQLIKDGAIKASRFMPVSPTRRQAKEQRVCRNDPCPCGSGKKFKQCCLQMKEEEEE